ncbi:MAG: hypothetical protein ACOY93_11235 [Bacillota bacterium]
MRDHWRQIPALLAGAGVLAATLYILALPGPRDPLLGPEGPAEAGIHGAGPLSEPVPPPTRPSDALARAVEQAARGTLPTTYFADRAEAARFLDRWRGQLVEGRALVSTADQFDAGAAEGHTIPVTLWLDSGTRVMGLAGEVAFEPSPGGLRIGRLALRPLPLAVRSWAEAERILAHFPTPGPVRSAAPFYGQFRFTAGDQRFAVDALTGRVSRE